MVSEGSAIDEISDENVFCNHSVETTMVEMRLVFDCKECVLEANLKQNMCMSGVLKALNDSLNADTVILSDYAELRYTGSAMKMLKTLVRLSNELENLSLRNPPKEYFANLKSQGAREKRAAACNACNSNPQIIFPNLKKLLLEDIEKFYLRFGATSRQVQGVRKPDCQPCKKMTEESLVYMFNLLEEFRAFLYYEGFRVLI